MAKSKTGKIATGLTLLGFLFVLIAFSTASWLVTDGELPNPKFEQIGKRVCPIMFMNKRFSYLCSTLSTNVFRIIRLRKLNCIVYIIIVLYVTICHYRLFVNITCYMLGYVLSLAV